MVESAALLVDEILPHTPIRQWVLRYPYPLRLLFVRYASNESSSGDSDLHNIKLLDIESMSNPKDSKVRLSNINPKIWQRSKFKCTTHMLFLDGVYAYSNEGETIRFHTVSKPKVVELTELVQKIAHQVCRSVRPLL